MIKTIALSGMGGIFALILVFHLLVVAKVIPYGIVWGGRLTSDRDMYRFEAVSLVLNAVFLAVVFVHAGLLPLTVPIWIMRVLFALMAALFALNTVGNLFSKNTFEKYTFTPITLLLTVFSVVLLVISLKRHL
jgi:hypothetical protein